MMPDLGKYADTVLSAYGFSLSLVVVLIAVYVIRSRKVSTALKLAEARRNA